MLRTRIITALILAPSIVAAIYLLDTRWLALVLSLITGAAAWEWAGLAGMTESLRRITYTGVVLALSGALFLVPQFRSVVLGILMVLWVIAAYAVVTYPRSARWIAKPAGVAIIGVLILPGVLVSLLAVHELPSGPSWMLFGLLICWAADIGAYFAGRALGRHKLAPEVSPGKTWEGAVGGWLFALIACGLILWGAGAMEPVWLLIMSGLVVVSIFGDLFESLLKRASGTKDSGSLLPGHGGVLDRIDSVLAVAPFFAFVMLSRAA